MTPPPTLQRAALDAELAVLSAQREARRGRPWICPCCSGDLLYGTWTAEQKALAIRSWARHVIRAQGNPADDRLQQRLFFFERSHGFPLSPEARAWSERTLAARARENGGGELRRAA